MKPDEKQAFTHLMEWPPDPDRWGEDPEAQAGQDAMFRLLQGG